MCDDISKADGELGFMLMKKYSADKTSLNLMRIVSFIILIGIIVGLKYILYKAEAMYPDYFAVRENTATEIIIWVLILLFVAAYVLFLLIYMPLWYAKAEYTVSEAELSARTGVINTTAQYMKLSAVQYVTVLTVPFSKLTGFNFIVLSAQGGKIVFLFLSRTDCDEIADFIRKGIEGRGE